ncbi:uncharacterized protein LOC113777401 [Coffea eugenioides]|uniref:uncharacterized protein LOC113777401 n=1 Tax=Coffea eugenioides TaxID=49369 RepID=UPI000F60F0C4|nr:uncharacterized protein LOC113777401 [Coffea eugenioides]
MRDSAGEIFLFGIPILLKSVPMACKDDEEAQEGFKKDSDMAAAEAEVAEQLMQLSGDEEDRQSIATTFEEKKRKDKDQDDDQGISGAESNCRLIESKKIRKDDPHNKGSNAKKRKSKYRSIDDIYMVTKPMNDSVQRS